MSETEGTTPAPESATTSDIRVAKPAWMPDAAWGGVRAQLVDKLNELVTGARAGVCPARTAWCERHVWDQHEDPADPGWCWSRTIEVETAQLSISNGTKDGEPRLWGLSEFESEAVPLGCARRVADAIRSLLLEVEQ